MSKNYLEQYERMKRWHKRFNAINSGVLNEAPSDYSKDDAYAFFINCYHLKDWLLNDSSIQIEKKEIEDLITESKFLSICADLCNGVKHLTRKKAPRIDANTKIVKTHVKIEIGRQTKTVINFDVKVNEIFYDAFSIASNCIKEWDDFLQKKGLLGPSKKYSGNEDFEISAKIDLENN